MSDKENIMNENTLAEGWVENPEFDKLWDKLVPSSGEAKTTAGEAVRAIGRFEYDYYNNGYGSVYRDESNVMDSFYKNLIKALKSWISSVDDEDNNGLQAAQVLATTMPNDDNSDEFKKAITTLKDLAVSNLSSMSEANEYEGAEMPDGYESPAIGVIDSLISGDVEAAHEFLQAYIDEYQAAEDGGVGSEEEELKEGENWEQIHQETKDGFEIVLSISPETEPYDGDDENGETQKKINNGDLWQFMSRVQAIKNGIVLGEDFLGGSVYEDPKDFVKDDDYYSDMVETAINNAKKAIEELKT